MTARPADQHLFGRRLRRWPEAEKRAQAFEMRPPPFEVWRSRDFLVQLFQEGDWVRMTVNRSHAPNGRDWADGITWDELQRLKAECGVGEDLLNEPVAALVHRLAYEAEIVFVSGRDAVCRAATEDWLWQHFPNGWGALFMRAEGDRRDDATVKLELLRDEIAPHWHVLGAIDDRNRVVRAWRRAGLLCLQVAEGAF